MAANKTPAPKARVQAQEQPQDAPQQEAEALPSPTEASAPEAPQHRTTVPPAPTGLVGGNSQVSVARIRAYVQASVYKPDEAQAAILNIQQINVARLHPSVAKYKAEALDYLQGKAKQ